MIVVFGEGRGFRVVWLLEEMGLAYRPSLARKSWPNAAFHRLWRAARLGSIPMPAPFSVG
jgi:hypothetical protein